MVSFQQRGIVALANVAQLDEINLFIYLEDLHTK